MNNTSPNDRHSLDWMFIAKGIGISLVVIGHFYPQSSPPYWATGRDIIYSFHMPLFFLLSGYLYTQGKYSYGSLIKAKVERLVYPFVSVALIFFLVKYFASYRVSLEHPITVDALLTLLIDPIDSFAPLLWFVHALFLIFIAFPLARRYVGNYLILGVLLALNLVFGSGFPVVGRALAYMPFFVVGVGLKEDAAWAGKLDRDAGRVLLPALFVFCALSYARLSNASVGHGDYLTRFVLGVGGSLLVMGLSQAISRRGPPHLRNSLFRIGYYSMTIYLLHPLFESTVRIALLQVFPRLHMPFLVTALLAIVPGIFLPLLLERYVLRKFSPTRKYILGLG